MVAPRLGGHLPGLQTERWWKMSEERPETCEMCGAPVVWCKCGMSEDIVERLRDLKKWYGFIMTTERMISSNQTIEAAAVEIERLTAENEKVCKALSDLYDACMQADGEGELHYTIDGDLLDAARAALVGEDASNAAEE